MMLLLLFLANQAFAQQRGNWTRVRLCEQCTPSEVAFQNSDTGLILARHSEIFAVSFLTHDGGKTFDTNLSTADNFGNKNYYRSLYGLKEGFLFVSHGRTLFSLNGKDWRSQIANELQGGVVNVQQPLSVDSIVVILSRKDTNYALISLDSGFSYDSLAPNQPAYSVVDGSIADSKTILLSESTTFNDFLAHLSDTGWVYTEPADTNGALKWTILEPIVKGAGRGHFFVLGGKIDSSHGVYGRTNDYYETFDGGVTWQAHASVAAGRVVRLANPEPNFIVVTVGHSPYSWLKSIDLNTDRQAGIPEKFIDSIFMSTDGGQTWTKDGESFAGDTIVDMWWVSSKLGYVLSYRDSATYLSRYDAASAAVVDHSMRLKLPDIKINPNPVSSHFTFTNLLPDAYGFNIVNTLGETVYSEDRRVEENQVCRIDLPKGLLPGCYELCIRSSEGTLSKVFIKL